MVNSDLTILSVYHSRESRELLFINGELTKKLNPGINIQWLVADSTPDGLSDTAERGFTVIRGAEKHNFLPKWIRPSFQHAESLNLLLPRIRTRFALVLDIDFFIVYPQWAREIVSHMQEAELGFFGVPWHPIYYRKFRYFPSHHSLFIDGHKVRLDTLDFKPQYDFSLKKRPLGSFLRGIVMRERGRIGQSRDTGYAIFSKYANGDVGYECAVPVWETRASFIDKLLPDRFSYLPKNSGYFSRSGFQKMGFFDVKKHQWEEFLWKEKPFGFHLRGLYRRKGTNEADFGLVRFALENFIQAKTAADL